ncbi:hypothetical protein [Paraburkholderia aromaticivorans]|uniref:hypothetical protein n=1 Tax=Paraburkholderia aromaticivorans TaxID=2026199 RepID=UPI001455EB9B|nr:hypothetical protein [Paraburkholderia aromaticivorans]
MGVVSVIAPLNGRLDGVKRLCTKECKARANDRRSTRSRMSLIYLTLIPLKARGSAGEVSNVRIRWLRRLKLHPREKASGHELASVRRGDLANVVRNQANSHSIRVLPHPNYNH